MVLASKDGAWSWQIACPLRRFHSKCGALPPQRLLDHTSVVALFPLTVWPSGLRRWLQAPVRKGVGSNPTAVILCERRMLHAALLLRVRRSCEDKKMTAVGFEATQFALVELESTLLDHSGKLSSSAV